MATSSSPHPLGRDPFHPPSRTPGPLGHNDAAAPDKPKTLLGDTPGPLGMNDHAAPPGAVVGGEANAASHRRTPPFAMSISPAGIEFIFKHEYAADISDRLHWPGGASGVTLGAGYDMKCRTRSQILSDLCRIGVDPAQAAIASKASGLAGDGARRFVRENSRNMRIRKEMAIRLLGIVIKEYEAIVKRNVMAPLHQHEYDALVSFAYNPGGRFIKVATFINRGEPSAAVREISAANTSGGHVMPGLVRRREDEVELFLNGRYIK